MSSIPLFNAGDRSPNAWDHVDDRIYEATKALFVHLICRVVAIKITNARTTVDCVPVHTEPVNDSGTLTQVDYPALVDVPVILPRGGGFSLTLPLRVGDIGVVLFHDHCLDNWWLNGGEQSQKQWERRKHDIADGMFLPSPQSCNGALANYSLNSMQLRSDDGTTIIDVAENGITITGGAVTINAQNSVTVHAPTVNVAANGGTAAPVVTQGFLTWFEQIFMADVTYKSGVAPVPPATGLLTTVLNGE
jgi:hypothetical protein